MTPISSVETIPNLPKFGNSNPESRVDFLLREMTLAEKADFLSSNFSGVPRLGIPQISWGIETVHGVGRVGRTTVFPSALSLASTFDPNLMETVAKVIGDEAMALYYWQESSEGKWLGLGRCAWSPVINIYRDPRWGRGQETYGEDPALTTIMALSYIRGLAGDKLEQPRIGCMVKHFAAHSGPEKDRHRMDIRVSPRDLHETYLPAFQATLAGGAVGLMGAYTRLNGEHCCASPELLQKLLREEWKFDGLVISDGGALDDLHGESVLHGNHGLTGSQAESAAYALQRGCQICLGGTYHHLPEAVERGLISLSEIDRTVREVLELAMRYGLLEVDQEEARRYPLSLVACEDHRSLARRVATDSMVLLKNDGILPLPKKINTLALVGPYLGAITPLLGNYYGFNERLVSPLEGIVGKLGPTVKILIEPGCDARAESVPVKWWTTHKPKEADLTIALMGIDPQSEGEEYDAPYSDQVGDRLHLGLPKGQQEYLETISQHGIPIVLVLISAGPLALPEFFANPNIRAIIHMGYSGQEGGNALADLLFGDANFSARLPVTWPARVEDLPPFEDYTLQGRGYRYPGKEPLAPFGFGLSTTTFAYEWMEKPAPRGSHDRNMEMRVRVTNTGDRAGAEAVQVYLSGPGAGTTRPLRQLCAVSKVFLQPGESREVDLDVETRYFQRIRGDGRAVMEPGLFQLTVGGSQGDARSLALGAGPVLRADLEML